MDRVETVECQVFIGDLNKKNSFLFVSFVTQCQKRREIRERGTAGEGKLSPLDYSCVLGLGSGQSPSLQQEGRWWCITRH